MRRTLLKYASSLLSSPSTSNPNPIFSFLPLSSTPSKFRFFSSQPEKNEDSTNIPDVDTTKFKEMINKYMKEGNEEALPSILEAILARKLSGKHEESDSEIIEDLEIRPPLDDVKDEEFDSDLDALSNTDEESE